MAVWGVMRLTALIFPGTKAWRSGVLLAFFPVSVFLLAGYAESLYMALVRLGPCRLVRGRPWLAATLTAFVGSLRRRCPADPGPRQLVLQDELAPRRHSIPGDIARIAGLCAVSLAPLFAYLVFVGERFGHVFEELAV